MDVTTVAAAIGVGPEHGGSLTAAAWMLQLTGIALFELWARGSRRNLYLTLHEDTVTPFPVSSEVAAPALPQDGQSQPTSIAA